MQPTQDIAAEAPTEPVRRAHAPAPRRWAVAACWVAALAAAFFFDAGVARWVRASGLEVHVHGKWFAELVKKPGYFQYTLIIAALLWFFHPLRWRAALFLSLCGIISGLNWMVKWIAGRTRPYKLPETIRQPAPFHLQPFRGGIHGLFFHTSNLDFPSGHACLSFATAAALAHLLPRCRVWFYLGALVVTAERVAENAHYLSDAVAGAAFGVLGVWIIRALLPRHFFDPSQPANVPRGFPVLSPGPVRERISSPTPHNHPTGEFMTQTPEPYISLVIPVYNEEENIPTLLQRVGAALQLSGKPFEVLVVDDGSTDGGPQMLEKGLRENPWLRVLRMAKNGGQSAAFDAGFKAARGQVIATIDGDLQNDPEEIPRLIPMLEGYDMITGWRKDRHDTRFRRFQTRFANRIRNWLSQETIQDSASSLKLYKRHCLEGIQLYNGMHRFMPTLVKMRGFTVLETPVKHSARFAGTAKYGFRNRALRAFIDLLAVRWMKKRYLRYQVSEVRPSN